MQASVSIIARQVWDFLTSPAQGVPKNPVDQHRVRVAAMVFLACALYIGMQLIEYANLQITIAEAISRDPVWSGSWVALTLLIVGYFLCRSRYYRISFYLLAWIGYLFVFSLTTYLRLSTPHLAIEQSYWHLFRYLYVGVLFGTVFLSARAATWLGAVTIATLSIWLLIFDDRTSSQTGWGYTETMLSVIGENLLVVLATAYWRYLQQLRDRQLRLALQQAEVLREKAEEVNRMKSAFLAITSHELRTPLNSIIGFTDCLLHGIGVKAPPMAGDQRDLLERIANNNKRLLGNINDILDMSKMEARRVEVIQEPFSPRDLLNKVLKETGAQATMKGLNITSKVSPNLPDTILGDAYLISRILTNLIANAIKFTEQGQVEVQIQPADQDRWQMVIKDTGIGIPPDRLGVIFEPFQQADSSLKRVYGGTGLGLTIARDNARLLGGDIQLESHVGVGSTFTVTLPLMTQTVHGRLS